MKTAENNVLIMIRNTYGQIFSKATIEWCPLKYLFLHFSSIVTNSLKFWQNPWKILVKELHQCVIVWPPFWNYMLVEKIATANLWKLFPNWVPQCSIQYFPILRRFYGTFSWANSNMSTLDALGSRWNSFQIRDYFEGAGSQYREKNLTNREHWKIY